MKRLIAIILVIIMIFAFTACDSAANMSRNMVEELTEGRFKIIELIGRAGDNYMYLMYDINTRVEYVIIEGYCELSICPYYDADGNVVIYGGS